MFSKKLFFACLLAAAVHFSISAQTHIAVPLGHPVYHVIEQAQMRGLLRHLPGARPFSRAQILSYITEILGSDADRRFGRLSDQERAILRRFQEELNPRRFYPSRLCLLRGTYSGEQYRNNFYFAWEVGFGFDIQFGVGFFPIAGGYRYQQGTSDPAFEGADHPQSGDIFTSLDMSMPTISWKGDMGRYMSYGVSVSGRMFREPRSVLGNFVSDAWYDGDPSGPRRLTVYSEPRTYFPFSHRKRWDRSLRAISGANSGEEVFWPDDFSIGYTIMPEFAATALGGNFFFRIARLEREWAAMTNNSSLVLNESAQPFLGVEFVMVPFHRMKFSSLTGVLESHNGENIQSAFSLILAELNWQNLHIGMGSTAIWPRRFDLGYIFPWADNLLSQNNSDNVSGFFNLQGRHPALGKAWFSIFLDEMDFSKMMFAFQFGASTHVPIRRLPFSTVTASYTRVNPFTYAHNRIRSPWHGDSLAEQNYVNFGRPLGSYLPPNSDEILVRFETLPNPHSRLRAQYQLIQHGAAFGNRAVAGSSVWSEQGPQGANLYGGAYEWLNILRLRGDYSFTGSNIPIRVFAEIGTVHSFFADNSFRKINSAQYSETLRFIANVGIQIFPK